MAVDRGDGGPRRPLTPAQKMKIQAWERQAAALGAPAYRLQLKSRQFGLNTYNLGKNRGPDGTEQFYTAEEVTKKISFLSRENARGYDIYIAPIDPTHHYLVVDDMTPAATRELVAAGYRPALMQESSKDNRQAVLKVPREEDADRKTEQSLANDFVRELNQRWGDPAFSGAVHPFRMAGFSNKKPGKLDAFTRILEAPGGICQQATDDLAAARRQHTAEIKRRSPAQEAISVPVVQFELVRQEADTGGGLDAGQVESLYAAAAEKVHAWVRRRRLEGNQSKIDFHVAVDLLRNGVSQADVARAIEVGSPDLAERHPNVRAYLERTIQAAQDELAGRRPVRARVMGPRR